MAKKLYRSRTDRKIWGVCGGLAKFIYDLVVGNLSESAVFAFLSAFIIWAIGLLSDQISKFGLAPKQK